LLRHDASLVSFIFFGIPILDIIVQKSFVYVYCLDFISSVKVFMFKLNIKICEELLRDIPLINAHNKFCLILLIFVLFIILPLTLTAICYIMLTINILFAHFLATKKTCGRRLALKSLLKDFSREVL